jgi:hypothetical protein
MVGNPELARHIVEEDHDMRVPGQIVASGARLAFGFPECTEQTIELPPPHRGNRPNAFGTPDHRLQEIQYSDLLSSPPFQMQSRGEDNLPS